MCKGCVEAFEELWPELTKDERMTFLWECTAFPVGDNTRERLTYFLGKCGKDLNKVMELNYAEADAAMAEAATQRAAEEVKP